MNLTYEETESAQRFNLPKVIASKWQSRGFKLRHWVPGLKCPPSLPPREHDTQTRGAKGTVWIRQQGAPGSLSNMWSKMFAPGRKTRDQGVKGGGTVLFKLKTKTKPFMQVLYNN